MKAEAWWSLCKASIAVVLLSAAAALGFKYLLPPLLPFIAALVIASLIRPVAEWCKKHIGIGAKPISVIIVLALFSLLCFLAWAAGSRLIDEGTKFIITLSEGASSTDSPIYKLTRLTEKLRDSLPISGEGAINITEITVELIKSGTAALTSTLTAAAGTFIKGLPSAVLSSGICLISLFYLVLDHDGIARAVKSFFPTGSGERLIAGYRRISHALSEYIRAYLLIMLITFAELYLGFTVIKIEYSLLFAVVIALVDFLPLFGVGTVLIPWGGAALLLGDCKLGIGLLVIYAAVCTVRQLIEPRIMGNFIGTHPLIALAGVYAGLKLFGFVGMIAAPITLYLIKALREDDEKSKDAG